MNRLDLSELIANCKRDIEYYANQAGLKFSSDDIVSIHEENLGEIMFLTRFNPHEIIGEDGNVIIKWQYTMWFERVIGQPILDTQRDGEKYTFNYYPGRVAIAAPWLIRIIKPDGTIVKRV